MTQDKSDVTTAVLPLTRECPITLMASLCGGSKKNTNSYVKIQLLISKFWGHF